jgi:cytochrome bd-type quinol oxidase subunit 2
MNFLALLVLPLAILPLGLFLLIDASGGWRAKLGVALASVAGWFALIWALIGSLVWIGNLGSCLRSPRTFNQASAVAVLVLGYVWVFVLAWRARKARTASLLGAFFSFLLLLLALGIAAALLPR